MKIEEVHTMKQSQELLKMVSKRRKFLAYMKKKEPSSYEKLIKKLDLKR